MLVYDSGRAHSLPSRGRDVRTNSPAITEPGLRQDKESSVMNTREWLQLIQSMRLMLKLSR